MSRTRTFGLIVLDRKGKIKVISELAAGLLEIFFSDFEHDVLPEELRLFVDEQNARLAGREYFGPADVLRIRRQDSELQIRLAFDFNSDELKLFIEDKKDLSPDDLSSLGLTRRETEVMYLICKGKTDETVGRICGINVRTVQKHVENIFTKLGVETRTAAMSYALENTRR